MSRDRGEEKWAAACLRQALPGVQVEPYDDGSRPGMHDFNLTRAGHKFAALEVTSASDAESITLWKIMHREGLWVHDRLVGGWMVGLLPSARVKRVRAELPRLLAKLEDLGVTHLNEFGGAPEEFFESAERLGVVSAHQSATDFPGSIYCTIALPPEQAGGWVADTGDALATWISAWVCEPSQADNLGKLSRSQAEERHLFVLLPVFTTAPFEAFEPLVRHDGPLPTVTPELPDEITHLWVMSQWASGDGFAWAPDSGWRRFQKLV
ncbi:hypothetical protein [Streptomyces roseoviridis]|uniref:Uncharacterized protein n=1 Tax=Streptomyces roseoviridis TaxID=67361 RepID=A0ABV5QVK5_9ACTN